MILFLAFTFPLAIYFLILASINRRRHPVLVSGAWDFAGVLFGLSGFLIVVGPAILSSSSERWRDFWRWGDNPSSAEAAEVTARIWQAAFVLYFAGVVLGSAFLLWTRRNLTSIYNIVPTVFDDLFSRTSGSLGLGCQRIGNRWLVGGKWQPESEHLQAAVGTGQLGTLAHEWPVGGEPAEQTARSRLPDENVEITVEPFPAFRHITLRWDPFESRLREEIETKLVEELAKVYTSENPAGAWFLGIATSLMCVTFFGLLLAIVLLYFRRI